VLGKLTCLPSFTIPCRKYSGKTTTSAFPSLARMTHCFALAKFTSMVGKGVVEWGFSSFGGPDGADTGEV
jgi:hypothetical protein